MNSLPNTTVTKNIHPMQNGNSSSNLKLFIGLLGISICIVLGYLVLTNKIDLKISSPSSFLRSFGTEKVAQVSITPTPTVYAPRLRSVVPSSCGYAVGQPTTAIDNPHQEWIYEEIEAGPESFRGLVPASVTNKGVLLAAMQFKEIPDMFATQYKEKGSYEIARPGLVSYCVQNSQGWDLDAFISHINQIKSDQFTYDIVGGRTMWGEIELQQIHVNGILRGTYVNEPLYLSVIPAGSSYSRLVIFQPWKSKEERIDADVEAISRSLAPRELTTQLVVPAIAKSGSNGSNTTNTTTGSDCVQFKIYEGQFASDKCYTNQDATDLKYNLQRYNSAVTEQNIAARGSQITCNGTEFFRVQCEEDKQQYDQALKDQEKYKTIINEIIARGK